MTKNIINQEYIKFLSEQNLSIASEWFVGSIA
jgi:hypothetical protein